MVSDRLRNDGEECQLTRGRDVSLPAEQRSAVGNYYQPEVFLSVHVGASPSAATNSFGVYVQQYSADQLADPEATVKEVGGQSTCLLDNFAGQGFIHWELAQREYLPESRRLASFLRDDLSHFLETRGHLIEAPLAVLSPVMAPAVLVEIGFLTNSAEQEKLLSANYRAKLADVLVESMLRFIRGIRQEP
jgi:N-acetylmuramoyl-L-alanine amidase